VNVVVVGGGAMGVLFSAIMSKAGAQVSVFDVSQDVVTAINTTGVTLRRGDQEATYPVSASTTPGDVAPDLILFLVKAHHTESAARAVAPIVGDDTVIATLQNGWGNAEVIESVLGTQRMVVGVTYNSAKIEDLGVTRNTGQGPTFLGGYSRGTSEDAARFADLLTAGGAPTTVPDEIFEEIWNKLTLNTAALPPSALTDLNVAQMYASSDVMSIVDGIATETAAVARAQGIDIDSQERVEFIRDHFAKAGEGQPSMLQDARAKRKTEVEVLNGAVVRAAQEVGVPAPLNQLMVSLIHGLESGWGK